MKDPTISVITVCFNAENLIENTIKSIISQTYANIEYIVIDGGSYDGTLEVIKKYREKISYFVSEQDKGIYDAMNKGTLVSTGDWVLFMNAGDTFFSDNTISEVVKECNDGADIIYGDVKVVEKIGSYILQAGTPDELSKGEISFCHQSSFIRSSLMKSHLYDLQFRVCADFNLFFHLWKEGCSFYHVNIPVAVYDVSQGSYAQSHFKQAKIEEYIIMGKNNFSNRIKLQALLIKNSIKQALCKLEPEANMIKRRKKSLSSSKRVLWHSW